MPVPGGTTLKFSNARWAKLECLGRPVMVDLHRMVDHEVARDDGIDPGRITTHGGHRVAHGHQVDHAGDSGEVLQDHPGGHERDFAVASRLGGPCRELRDVGRRHRATAHMPEGIFEEHTNRERQSVEHDQTGSLEGLETVHRRGDLAHRQGATGVGEGRLIHGAINSAVECLLWSTEI
jgi:hypothetical protein